MSDPAPVADASAIIALLMSEPFRGFDPDLLIGSAISSLNFCEVLTKLVDLGFSPDQARDSVGTLDLRVQPFSENNAYDTVWLRTMSRPAGLSLADRACLALGLSLKRPVVTGDRAWAGLDIGVEIILIR